MNRISLAAVFVGCVAFASGQQRAEIFLLRPTDPQPIEVQDGDRLRFDLVTDGAAVREAVQLWAFPGTKQELKALKDCRTCIDARGCIHYVRRRELADLDGFLLVTTSAASPSWLHQEPDRYTEQAWVLVAHRGIPIQGAFYIHKDEVEKFFDSGLEIRVQPSTHTLSPIRYREAIWGPSSAPSTLPSGGGHAATVTSVEPTQCLPAGSLRAAGPAVLLAEFSPCAPRFAE